jgi:hypothetical protein
MDITDHDCETVNLLRFERAQLRAPTNTWVTFYEGTAPLDYIKGRVADICKENPWLQGKLSSHRGRLALRYQKRSSDPARSVRMVRIPEMSCDMSCARLAAVLRDSVIERGSLCVNTDAELFRVTVVDISDSHFALVMSMSHVYADGHTFYEIYKMLSTSEPVRPLIVERVYSSRDDIEAAIRGGDDSLPWLMSPGFIINVVGTWLRGRTATFNVYTVNQHEIDERKKEYETGHKPGFISTNDIITAEFFSNSACDVVFTTVNFRERIPHLTKDHAGNYECVIAFQREDFARPELIRRAWADYRRSRTGKLPGFWRSTRVKLGALTNLTSFYQDVELPGCRLLLHRPAVVDATAFLPFEHAVYVFKCRQKQVSLFTYCKDTSVLANVAILEQRIA